MIYNKFNADTKRYFGDHDIEGMFATLAPLHDLIDKVNGHFFIMRSKANVF